ncbi:MAG: hypothetical protein J3K34DRAFT_416255 [Monoraphidium minutum]|nr:MAG: hypothetical protein J3K34DRAFT_416255 [Monoraphidium minutum]
MLAQQAGSPEQDLFRVPRLAAWVKLRPGARDALRLAGDRFELWLRTAGPRAYGAALAELLGARHFGGRVIAAGDGPEGMAAAAGLEGKEPLTVVLDDAGCSWVPDRANLLVAERYVFLPTARVKGRPTLMEMGRDECPQRGMLATAFQTLGRMHAQVFERVAVRAPQEAWDVRGVMESHRRRVLAGVHLVFSHVTPAEADPRGHPLWRLAEQFGGVCAEAPSDATTHVVAAHAGTEKALWALNNGKHVVSPAWLECSCVLWHRANESRFQPAH